MTTIASRAQMGLAPSVDLRREVHVAPQKILQRALHLPQAQVSPRVLRHRPYLQAVADDALRLHERGKLPLVVAGHDLGIEVVC